VASQKLYPKIFAIYEGVDGLPTEMPYTFDPLNRPTFWNTRDIPVLE